MNKKSRFSVIIFVFLLIFAWFLPDTSDEKKEVTDTIKIALRGVGDQLLLAQKDSISLILPVVKIADDRYQLAFQKQLSFDPGDLVTLIEKSFIKAQIFSDYLVKVIQCSDKEVAYSYQVKNTVEKSIIPCRGRFLPQNCYQIEVTFINKKTDVYFTKTNLLLLVLVLFIFIQFQIFKKKKTSPSVKNTEKYTTIGSFQFYVTQNKLVKEAEEIPLSKKECELLKIFVDNPNKIIKREELTKKVWEDNGVFVSRSLDTYISKLRKKLKGDNTIKLINVHGIGYKLEIDV